ncbi:MAG: prephenate dehydratase, partial [Calditrichia bacterium]|nr:prephenate dehydratase [Calditrichia bacterium]
HQVGSLVEILDILKRSHINLTLIQSVPIPGHPDEYSFHIDLEWSHKDDFQEAMKEVRKYTQEVFLLGIYKKGEKP